MTTERATRRKTMRHRLVGLLAAVLFSVGHLSHAASEECLTDLADVDAHETTEHCLHVADESDLVITESRVIKAPVVALKATTTIPIERAVQDHSRRLGFDDPTVPRPHTKVSSVRLLI